MFGFPWAQEHKISSSVARPALVVTNAFSQIIQDLDVTGKPSLLLFHYAGHGEPHNASDVLFTGSSKKRIINTEFSGIVQDEVKFSSSRSTRMWMLFSSLTETAVNVIDTWQHEL